MTAIGSRKVIAAVAIAVLSVFLSHMDPFVGGTPPGILQTPGHVSDFELYRRIIADVRGGRGYYEAAVSELTANGMAVRPVPTIRLPTLAILSAAISPTALNILHLLLAGGSALVWGVRLRTRNPVVVALALALGWRWAFAPSLLVMHETWAGMLVVLALGLRTERSWGASLAAGMLACAFRETAIVLPAIMIVTALAERRWRETAGWCAGLLLVGAAYAWHAHLATLAAAAVPDTGLRTHWWTHQELYFALGATIYATGLAFFLIPKVLAYGAVLCGYLGWLQSRDGTFRRVGAYLVAWIAIMAICAQNKNFYWAVMYATLVPLGAALLLPEVTFASREEKPSRIEHANPDEQS